VLTDTEVEVASEPFVGLEVAGAGNMRRVLVDGARSADPHNSHGTACASAFEHRPEASRVAMPLASAAG
jgi:hypothetical protein